MNDLVEIVWFTFEYCLLLGMVYFWGITVVLFLPITGKVVRFLIGTDEEKFNFVGFTADRLGDVIEGLEDVSRKGRQFSTVPFEDGSAWIQFETRGGARLVISLQSNHHLLLAGEEEEEIVLDARMAVELYRTLKDFIHVGHVSCFFCQ